MHAYRFRILTDEQDDFVRDVEILASQTFLDFHNYLVRLLEFNSNELASFSICNTKWYKLSEITLLDMQVEEEKPDDEEDNNRNNRVKTFLMADSRLRDFIEDPHQRLIYEYDFLNLKTFYLELSKIVQAENGLQYPRCIHSEGILQKKTAVTPDAIPDDSDLSPDDFGLGEGEKEFEDELDDAFLGSLSEGFEIEIDRTIEMNMDESFEPGPEDSGRA